MNILAIDLGTHVGYCYNVKDEIHAGTRTLATPKEVTAWGKERLDRRKDPRVERMCELVSGFGTFDAIIFEDVEFVKSRKQAHLWSALRTAAWLCGHSPVYECVATGTLKKFATGMGNADKAIMGAALQARHPDRWSPGYDDNAVDAIWLHIWGQHHLGRLRKQ